MAVELDTRGRPYVRCPGCGVLHRVRLSKTFIQNPRPRYRCGACGTTWPARPEERETIRELWDRKQNKRPKKADGGKQRSIFDRVFGG